MVTDDKQKRPEIPIDEYHKVETDKPEIKKSSIIPAAFLMFVLSVILGWIPFIGAFVAGYEGGKRAGSLPGALIAVIVPILLVTLLFKYAFSILYFKEEVSDLLIIVVFNSILFFGAFSGGLNTIQPREL